MLLCREAVLDYEADVSQAGIKEESSFSQDPLALAETDPLLLPGVRKRSRFPEPAGRAFI